MKKYIIIASIISLLIGGIALAKVDLTYRLDNEHSGQIYSRELDQNNVSLLKILDGDNTCYITVIKVGGNSVNSNISCLKIK